MSQRSAIFASPARKTSRIAELHHNIEVQSVQETVVVEREEETAEERENEDVEEMEVDGTLPGIETPKRNSLSRGRRRSINVQNQADSTEPVNEDSVFDLLMPESILQQSEKNPMLELARGRQQFLEYYEELEKQLERFDVVQQSFEKKVELAKRKTDEQYLTPFNQQTKNLLFQKESVSESPSNNVLRYLSEFRKFSKDARSVMNLEHQRQKVDELTQEATNRLIALQNLVANHTPTAEQIAAKNAEKEELLKKIDEIRLFGQDILINLIEEN
ncbi:unnamed protein product [Caenorhabditis angaria]|uniref:Uncharacterized protein n=1 Tax=Caenorhabditis angaria TaxID=860376 RepID=A0A9P1IEZ9_9PELO|nr:unnamed protein product [Caenorhabditis angaria]